MMIKVSKYQNTKIKIKILFISDNLFVAFIFRLDFGKLYVKVMSFDL